MAACFLKGVSGIPRNSSAHLAAKNPITVLSAATLQMTLHGARSRHIGQYRGLLHPLSADSMSLFAAVSSEHGLPIMKGALNARGSTKRAMPWVIVVRQANPRTVDGSLLAEACGDRSFSLGGRLHDGTTLGRNGLDLGVEREH